jgi:hypothetical protein
MTAPQLPSLRTLNTLWHYLRSMFCHFHPENKTDYKPWRTNAA